VADPFFQSGFLGGICIEAVFDILFSPMIQKPGGKAVSPAELGCGTDPAQIFFNNLTLKIGTEFPLFSHDKILSALGLKILSDILT